MVEKQSHTENKKNVILDNWEFIDTFLAEFKKKESASNNPVASLFANLFRVRHHHQDTPSLNTIREKLWHYYYKERFIKATLKSKLSKVLKTHKSAESNSQELYS